MVRRGVTVWLIILLLANLNGALRELLLSPALGESVGRAVSTVLLAGLVLLVAWLTIRWIGPRTAPEALLLGVTWLLLTLAFEFGAGHFLFRKSWDELLVDYDLGRGRIWILVPITTLLAPVWAARVRRRVPAPSR
jgi:hypothetical protein